MKAVLFAESNSTLNKGSNTRATIPAYRHPSKHGIVITCWRIGFLERIKTLLTGKVYATQICGLKGSAQPLKLHTNIKEPFTGIRVVFNKTHRKFMMKKPKAKPNAKAEKRS